MAKKASLIFLSILLLLLFLIKPSKTIINAVTNKYNMDNYLEASESNFLFGILEIPSLNLKQPLYQKDQKENNVDQNVMILEKSDTFLALAAHSGNGPHAYFKNLDQLSKNDKIIIKTSSKIQEYQYFKREEVKKNGTIFVENYNFSYLVLITCSKTNNQIQEVFYAKLTKIY